MPAIGMDKTTIIMTRKNAILTEREVQLCLNRLALDGGRPYIDARLWRAPNESDLSWSGAKKDKGMGGRRDRACCVNDAGRIARKIDQYLFAKPADRAGIDEEWAGDVTNEGTSITQFWTDVSDEYTAGQWCWIQTDRAGPALDETGAVRMRTLADKAADDDFVFWRIWPSVSVPDWYFDAAGNLQWLLTCEESIDASDPFAKPVAVVTRTLWRRAPGGATYSRWQTRDGQTALVAEGTISPLEEIPFVCVGKPSAKPWWYDDVEKIQAQLMNLDSLHFENLVRSVFPQLVIPESTLSSLQTRIVEAIGDEDSERVVQIIREVVRGLDTPLVESAEDKGITRFIQPSANDLNSLPSENSRKRQILFDLVGLALFNRETRQVQSAESKQFDHLDTESTLCHRARVMQSAETRLVALSHELDPEWADYTPRWPEEFDVPDLEADMAALMKVFDIPRLTLTQHKVALRAVTRVLMQLADVTDEEQGKINEEIEAVKEEDFAFPTADFVTGGGDET